MMSTSPTLIDAFVTLRDIYSAGTLDAREREALGLANAVENGCEWCVAFHSFVALKLGVDEETVRRLRSGGDPDDARLRALTSLTRQLIRNRGRIDAADLDAFVAAGSARTRHWKSSRAWRCRSWQIMPATSSVPSWTRRSQPALVARQLVRTNCSPDQFGVPPRMEMPSAPAEVRKAICGGSLSGDIAGTRCSTIP